jgi:hypothetical protein
VEARELALAPAVCDVAGDHDVLDGVIHERAAEILGGAIERRDADVQIGQMRERSHEHSMQGDGDDLARLR